MSKPSKYFGEIAVNNKLRMSYHKNGKVKVKVIISQKVKAVAFYVVAYLFCSLSVTAA